jgi:hypothetical protein
MASYNRERDFLDSWIFMPLGFIDLFYQGTIAAVYCMESDP